MPKHIKDEIIGFIGGGNMARSLLGGLLNNGWARERLIFAEPDAGRRAGLAADLGVVAYADNETVAAQAQVLVFAVKPQVLRAAAAALAPMVQQRRPLIISVAAGIRADDLQRWLGGRLPIVRAMPNTPALVGAGATGLYANALTDPHQRDQAESILRTAGVVVWVQNEGLMDAVTALSGSGPAYFFLVMEAMEQAAMKLGLDARTARLLTIETAFGAAKMAEEGGEDPARLRERVTSPGGTTERALAVLHDGGLLPLFEQALAAAAQRAKELADLFGKDA
jgi:pyrroline-5-carboxylate reductase